jgi:hypothetical protein
MYRTWINGLPMTCDEAKPRLGEFLDGELGEDVRSAVEGHLNACPDCRAEYHSLRDMAAAIAGADIGGFPRDEIWQAVERRLDAQLAAEAVGARPRASQMIRFFRWRPLASAAAVALAVGLGWLLLSGPWTATAYAGRIDFRPLLEQASGDIQAGIDALLRAHGGRTITRSEAAERMSIRIDAPGRLPHDLTLQSMYLLNLGGNRQALGFHYDGPAGGLLLLQCPPGVSKNYGGYECLACQIGSKQGQIVRAGPLRLAHFESANVCVCVVSTLDETGELPAALDAVTIDF